MERTARRAVERMRDAPAIVGKSFFARADMVGIDCSSALV